MVKKKEPFNLMPAKPKQHFKHITLTFQNYTLEKSYFKIKWEMVIIMSNADNSKICLFMNLSSIIN